MSTRNDDDRQDSKALQSNLYNSDINYSTRTSKYNRRKTYFVTNENGEEMRVAPDTYNKFVDYNNFRNIANQGMAPQSNNPLDTKKRKKLFNEEETTMFGN